MTFYGEGGTPLKDRVRVVGGQNQERYIEILLYTPDLAIYIKGLLLNIKSPTPHNPTEYLRFAPFDLSLEIQLY